MKILYSIRKTYNVRKNIPIHSIRLPGVLSHHEVIFGGVSETFSIKTSSINRNAFLPGICFACKVVNKLKGLVYGLDNLL